MPQLDCGSGATMAQKSWGFEPMPVNSTEIQELLTKGLQAIDEQRFDDALQSWERVLELDPSNARAQRLVDDLSLLMNHSETEERTAPDGHDVVIVMDEVDDTSPEILIELPMKSSDDFSRTPSMITRNSLDRLRELLEEQTSENARLNDLISSRYAENLELRERLTFKDRELIEQRAELITLEKQVSSLDVERRDLERYTKQCERQIAEIELTQVEHRRAVERTKELEGQLQEINGELAALRTEFNGLREHATQLDEALQEADKERKLQSDRAMKFELQVGSRDKKIKELEKAVEEAQNETSVRDELENRVAELESELEAAKNDSSALEELEAKLAELEIDNAKLERLVEARDREIDDLASAASRAEMLEAESAAKDQDIEALQTDIAAIGEERDQLSKDLRTVNDEAEEARQALKEALARISELEQAVKDAKSDTSAVEEFKARLERQQALSEAKDAEIAQLYESHSATSARLDEKERQYERLAAQVEKSEASLREARSEVERLRKVDERSDTLELELSEAVAELHSERERADLNDRACRTLEARLSRQNTHLEDLERRLNEPSESVGMNELLAQKEQRIEELTDRVRSLESRLASAEKRASATDVSSAPVSRDDSRGQTGLGVQNMDTGSHPTPTTTGAAAATQFGMAEHTANDDEPAGIRQTATMFGNGFSESEDSDEFVIDMEIVDDMGDGIDEDLEADFEVLLDERPKSGKRQTAQTHAVPHGRHERKTGEQPVNGQDPITRIERIMHQIPRVLLNDPGALESPKEAFVIANIDGDISFADLIDIAGLPAEETGRILMQLIDRGVIEATN